MKRLRVLNLGAGVQSSVMLARAAAGDFGDVPDVAVFADTQAEPPHVYRQLDDLRQRFGHAIPIEVVTQGSLLRNLYAGEEGRSGFAQIPAYLRNAETGERGLSRRQCTYQYKIRPIEEFCRRRLGLRPGQWAKGKVEVEQWIGISTDESSRAKPSGQPWIVRRYPLLFDIPMRRSDCIEYAKQHELPIPQKSACFFCPYHRDREWREVRDQYPELWEQAIKLDDDLRSGSMVAGKGLRGDQYLHDTLIPLAEVDLDAGRDQPDLFGNECEGHCGT